MVTLQFFSHQDWVTEGGEIIKQDLKRPYERIVCTAADDELTIPVITTIPTTTDSPDVPSAVWTAKLFVGTKEYETWMGGFKIPHTIESPISWGAIRIYNNPPGAQPTDYAISFNAAVLLIRELTAGAGTGFVARGEAVLPVTGNVVTVPTSAVEADSSILCLSKTNTISGKLNAFDRVAGQSFKVQSDDGTDFGDFDWFIFERISE